MGKPTGFQEWERESPPRRSVEDRLADFREFVRPFSPEQARAQAGRCMDCGVPFCMQGCPLGNRIPDWNDLLYSGRLPEAWHALESTNNFPEFTGRLCPAPCEAACVLTVNQAPVSIEHIEKQIAELAFAAGWVKPKPPRRRSGFTVGVVGSGPAGLAAAEQLNRAGHRVTVYEREPRVGGLLRYGIPDFKMEKSVIDRRLAILEAEGVVFHTGIAIGSDLSWTHLRERHDALVIAIGAELPRDLDVPGRELSGVHFAMDFLRSSNRAVSGEVPPSGDAKAPPLDAGGKRVVILGGGDTGLDCFGTALRQGAISVTQVELMPSPDRQDADRWPRGPFVILGGAGREEGGERLFGLRTERLLGKDGTLEALEARSVVLKPTEDGDRRLVPTNAPASRLPCDLLLLAMGFLRPVADAVHRELGVALTPAGAIAVDDAFRTSAPGVYAAGDAQRGASLIVWAIADGREAARTLDADLRGADSALPTRGVDLPFGP